MTSKEKAAELYIKYLDGFNFDSTFRNCYEQSKQCALIAVDEIINATKGMVDEDNGYSTDSYWQEVKHEIKLL